MFIKDSTGEKSLTATAFILGFIVVNIKFLFAGMSFSEHIVFPPFSGGDYGMALSALGAIYILRRYNPVKPEVKG
jgi:amino acid transporter